MSRKGWKWGMEGRYDPNTFYTDMNFSNNK